MGCQQLFGRKKKLTEFRFLRNYFFWASSATIFSHALEIVDEDVQVFSGFFRFLQVGSVRIRSDVFGYGWARSGCAAAVQDVAGAGRRVGGVAGRPVGRGWS
ncbi:MAG: hypothetical protein F4038_13325 [Chloroflexi bacterium]|nr:hypothetical protein [Chloroflexota bacterium]MYJ94015.1 hypothetical protein [Chloroflexota bacterium]